VIKKISLFAVVLFTILFAGYALAKYADLAGLWYTSSPKALKAEIEEYLKDAVIGDIKGDVIGVIAPHAGTRASGSVAAYAFNAAAIKMPDTAVIVGFSHRRALSGVAVFTDKSFVTPLGEARTDLALSRKFIEYDDRIVEFPRAFDKENSIEMEIPFVQVALPEAKIVLILIGDQKYANVKLVSEALYNVLKVEKGYTIIASTDMCHYLPYEAANKRDRATIKAVKSFDPEIFYAESMRNQHELMCGYGAVSAVMSACKKLGADEVSILKYANSGDTIGGKDGVVGYLSAAFIKKQERGGNKPAVKDKVSAKKGEDGMFNREQREKLLKLARNTITHYLKTGERLEPGVDDGLLKQDMGAFVTLHKNGQLRGCIGHMVASGPLYLTVRDMAIAAATEDPRFPKVTLGEMEDIDIEISALSPMEKIEDYQTIEMGKHGVMVRSGWQGGVYLPQVATETGWDREEFMNSLCAQKAGIPADSWKKGECDIYVFTAEVFGEKEDGE